MPLHKSLVHTGTEIGMFKADLVAQRLPRRVLSIDFQAFEVRPSGRRGDEGCGAPGSVVRS